MLATISNLDQRLQKIGFIKTDSKLKEGHYFISGNNVIILLPDSLYKNNQREQFLKLTLQPKLIDFDPEYKKVGMPSSAGGLTFRGSQIKLIAKIGAAPGKTSTNKGNQFEDELLEDFKLYQSEKYTFKYTDFMSEFIQKDIKHAVIKKAEKTGGENTPRPILMTGKELYISVKGGGKTFDVGDALADLKVHTEKSQYNISCKYGETVSFFNAGVGRIFPAAEFTSGKFSSPMAYPLLNLFGIDYSKFIGVFLNYKESAGLKVAPKDYAKSKADPQKISEFLKSGIGMGYYLVHKHKDNSVSSYLVDQNFLNRASKITSDIIVEYPVGGSAKRVDIKVETELFKFKFNFRPKSGGVFPTHLMCDYSFKH